MLKPSQKKKSRRKPAEGEGDTLCVIIQRRTAEELLQQKQCQLEDNAATPPPRREEKGCQAWVTYLTKICFKNEGKLKVFPEEQQVRERPYHFLCEPCWEDPQTVGNNAQWEVRRHRGTRSYRIRKYEGNSSERKGGPRGRRAGQPTGVEGAGRERTQRMVQRKE